MSINKSIGLITFAFISTLVKASVPTDIDAMASKILENNPEVAMMATQNKATLQEMKIENNLPATEISFSHEWGHKGVGNKTGVEISQGFDWPGAYRARSESMRETASALDLLSRQRRSELMLEIKQQLITLWAAGQKKRLYERAVGKIDSLSKIVEREVERHEVSKLDGNKLKIERIALARKLAECVDAYHIAYGALLQLNGGTLPDDLISDLHRCSPSVMLRPLEAYYEMAGMNNYDTAYRKQLAKASRAKEKALKLSNYPGFSLGLTYENEMGDHFTGFNVGLTLPFFSNRGKSEASRLTTESIEAESAVNEAAIRARIHTDYLRAEQLDKELSEYASVIENEDNIRLLDRAFDARHISLLDYISDLIYFTEAAGNYIDLKLERLIIVASLDRYATS